MLELTGISNRFNYDSATHHSKVLSEDGQILNYAVKGSKFGCCTYESKSRGRSAYDETAAGSDKGVAIMTNDNIAATFKELDRINWSGRNWLIERVESKRTLASMVARVYIIWLK